MLSTRILPLQRMNPIWEDTQILLSSQKAIDVKPSRFGHCKKLGPFQVGKTTESDTHTAQFWSRETSLLKTYTMALKYNLSLIRQSSNMAEVFLCDFKRNVKLLGLGILDLLTRGRPVETGDEHRILWQQSQNWAFLAIVCMEVVILVNKLSSGLDLFHLPLQNYFLLFFQPALSEVGWLLWMGSLAHWLLVGLGQYEDPVRAEWAGRKWDQCFYSPSSLPT